MSGDQGSSVHDRWTFTTAISGDAQNSSQRFTTPGEAIDAAAEWLKICAENGVYPAVGIVKVQA